MTAAPVEIELKFALGATEADRMRSWMEGLPGAKSSNLFAVYYDTPDLALQANGFSLRVRRKGERHIQTLKRSRAGLFERDEWETDVPGPALDLAWIKAAALGETVDARRLGEAFTVEVERVEGVWDNGLARVEVSLDRGEVRSGHGRAPILELELELLAGDPNQLFVLARELLALAPLVLAFSSKSERGYALLGVRSNETDPLKTLSAAALQDDGVGLDAALRALRPGLPRELAARVQGLGESALGSPELPRLLLDLAAWRVDRAPADG